MAVSQTLSVTNVDKSVDNIANTSKVRILWQSTQTGDSWNGYTKTAKFYVSINGGAEKEYSVSYTLPKGTTKTIVDTTITVPHKPDGSGTVKVRTWMDTSISAGVIEKSQTINLTNIPRASTIAYVSNVTLGNACTVKWYPQSKDFRYRLVFLVWDWWYISDVIHPNTTSIYTDSSCIIPIEVAKQFPNSKDADMTVELYTYSDEAGTIKVGTEAAEACKVYIPENEDTLPTAKMNLSPVSTLSEAFKGLYIQSKTRVQADFTGSEAKYSASIKSYWMTVNGKEYIEPYQSDLLSKSGTISVKGSVTDTRNCSSSTTQNIEVIAYSKPSLVPYSGESSIVCKRCDPNGNINPSGTSLRIKAGRQYSKITANDTQKNFCSMKLKYKAEGATSWAYESTILKESDTADSVDVIPTGISLSTSTTYLVQIEVADTIGESSSTLITIPTADVTVHLRAGGKAIGVGKYAEKDNILDIDDEWEVNIRGQLSAGHIAKIDLYDGKDFNTLIYKTGYYTSKSAPIGAGSTNYPINETGVLEVISAMENNSGTWWGFAYQTYRTYTGKVYMRNYYSTTGWTAWKQVNLT